MLADPARKVEVHTGDFSHRDRPALVCDTQQRQAALDEAARGADWVLQLDADEVVPDLGVLSVCLDDAVTSGAEGLDFPARWLYAKTRRGFLERSSRFWGPANGYPGPIAVRSGTKLDLARQTSGRRFRVDVRAVNTDPFRDAREGSDRVVDDTARILHFSWARPVEVMRYKAVISGHAGDDDWSLLLRRWDMRRRHPWWATAMTPIRRKERQGWLRHRSLPCLEPARRF